jgi:hypothetical protein
MTNREALKSLIAFPVEGNAIEKALIDHAIAPDETYVTGNKVSVEAACIDVLRHVKQLKSFSEGDLSFAISESAIDAMIADLSGTPDNPTISDATNLW